VIDICRTEFIREARGAVNWIHRSVAFANELAVSALTVVPVHIQAIPSTKSMD
jgi:hypothetical protein